MKMKIKIWLAVILALSCFALFNNASAAKTCSGENLRPQSAKITVKIINKGAPANVQRAIRELLASQKQLKVTIGNGKGPDIDEYVVFFKEDKFMLKAQAIAQLLREKEEIFSYARKAETTEEKSADIVIMLGKSKEAPPA